MRRDRERDFNDTKLNRGAHRWEASVVCGAISPGPRVCGVHTITQILQP